MDVKDVIQNLKKNLKAGNKEDLEFMIRYIEKAINELSYNLKIERHKRLGLEVRWEIEEDK